MPIAPQIPSGIEGCWHEGAAGAGSATAMPGSTRPHAPVSTPPSPVRSLARTAWYTCVQPAPRCYSVLKSLAGCVRAAASPGTPRQHSPAPAQHNGDEHRNELAGWLMQHALTPIAECGQLTGGNRMRVAAVVAGNARAAPPPGRRRMGSGSWRSGLGPHSACCSFVPHSNGRYAARRAKVLEDHPHDAAVRSVGSRFCPSHGTCRMAWVATF
jgi:hypothetical protein